MTSLTQTSITTRKTIRYTLYAIILFTFFRWAFYTGIKIYRYFYPLPPAPPEVAFKVLPALPFPEKSPVEGISYTLETPEGGFPKLPTQVKVFFMPKIYTQLGSLDATKQKAVSLGFLPDGAEITETVYRFPHPKVPAELNMSITTGIFSMGYNLAQDPSPLERKPVAPEVATSKARSFLSSSNLLAEDLTGPTTTEYVKLENDKIIGAGSLSDANFIKVNIFRKNYEDYPSLTSDPKTANVWFIISGDPQKEKLVIAGEYHYFPIDETKSSTYPIKTPQQAWEELTTNKAFIASTGQNANSKAVTIRRVYLAYYDSGVAMDFYQPIIVFESDKESGFMAFVPAVTSEYYKQAD